MFWVGRELKGHPVPTAAMGRDPCHHLQAAVAAEQGCIYMTRRVTRFYGVYMVFSDLGELGQGIKVATKGQRVSQEERRLGKVVGWEQLGE